MSTCTPYSSSNIHHIPNFEDHSSGDLSRVSFITLTVSKTGHHLAINYDVLNSKHLSPGDVVHIFGIHSSTIDCCVVEKPDSSVIDSFLAVHKIKR